MTRNLITKEGFKNLQAELDTLWRIERPETTKIVTWAASLGDRSENADYQYNKKKLREIDRRIRYLRKTLEDIEVIEYHPQQEGNIYFGAWVNLEDDEGERLEFRIVGAEEIYGQNAYISIDSPMAKSCIGKKIDDEIEVPAPSGNKSWHVLNIRY